MKFIKYIYSLFLFLLGAIRPRPRPNSPMRINIIGDIHSESGLGSVTRKIIDSIGRHYECQYINLPLSKRSRQRVVDCRKDTKELKSGVNLFIGNPEILLRAFLELNFNFLIKNYNIGLWFWELESKPKIWTLINNLIDEIWVQSEFIEDIFSSEFSPVLLMPFSLGNVEPSKKTRQDLGLPVNSFNFIFTFDFLSHIERKNPKAVIDAFIKAFGDSPRISLVIKSVNGEHAKEFLAQIKTQISKFRNIHLANGFIDSEDLYRMIQLSNCYVSLHRSEGLGLGMAEAMKLGVLVIATGYSGNLSFMNEHNSLLVNYKMRGVRTIDYPYSGCNFWADPDINDAAEKMRLAFEDQALYKRLVDQAYQDINKYTNTSQRLWIEDRLRKIQ